jgi:hypothetical protein
VSRPAVFQVGDKDNGELTRADQEYALVAIKFLDTVGWDLSLYDSWLFGGAHWRSVPKIRQTLIELRNDLAIGLHCAQDDERTACALMMTFSRDVLKLTSN